MALITIPPAVRIANLQWSQPPSYQLNRSELTGKTRTVELGPATRWSASGRLAPTKANDARSVRAFLAAMSRPENVMRLRMTQRVQVTTPGRPTSALVNGAGQLGLSLIIDGLWPSSTNLYAGDIVSVELIGSDWQPLVLATDLVANASGQAIMAFTTPLRRSPGDNATIELSLPFAVMRMRNPLQWGVAPTPLYESPCDFEEAF